MTRPPLDLADILAHTRWTTTAPTTPQPTPTNPFPAPFPSGPRVHPTTPTWPATAEPTGDLDNHWWPTRDADDFPVRTDPALDGHDPLPVTAADAGLTHDPIAVVLELRARLEAAIEQLTPQQRHELAQYHIFDARKVA